MSLVTSPSEPLTSQDRDEWEKVTQEKKSEQNESEKRKEKKWDHRIHYG